MTSVTEVLQTSVSEIHQIMCIFLVDSQDTYMSIITFSIIDGQKGYSSRKIEMIFQKKHRGRTVRFPPLAGCPLIYRRV